MSRFRIVLIVLLGVTLINALPASKTESSKQAAVETSLKPAEAAETSSKPAEAAETSSKPAEAAETSSKPVAVKTSSKQAAVKTSSKPPPAATTTKSSIKKLVSKRTTGPKIKTLESQETKSIGEEKPKIALENVEDTETKERMKKSATTICLEIRPTEDEKPVCCEPSQPTQIIHEHHHQHNDNNPCSPDQSQPPPSQPSPPLPPKELEVPCFIEPQQPQIAIITPQQPQITCLNPVGSEASGNTEVQNSDNRPQFPNILEQLSNLPQFFPNPPQPFPNDPNHFAHHPYHSANHPHHHFANHPHSIANTQPQFIPLSPQYANLPNPSADLDKDYVNFPGNFPDFQPEPANIPQQFPNIPQQSGNNPQQSANLPQQQQQLFEPISTDYAIFRPSDSPKPGQQEQESHRCDGEIQLPSFLKPVVNPATPCPPCAAAYAAGQGDRPRPLSNTIILHTVGKSAKTPDDINMSQMRNNEIDDSNKDSRNFRNEAPVMASPEMTSMDMSSSGARNWQPMNSMMANMKKATMQGNPMNYQNMYRQYEANQPMQSGYTMMNSRQGPFYQQIRHQREQNEDTSKNSKKPDDDDDDAKKSTDVKEKSSEKTPKQILERMKAARNERRQTAPKMQTFSRQKDEASDNDDGKQIRVHTPGSSEQNAKVVDSKNGSEENSESAQKPKIGKRQISPTSVTSKKN